MTREHVLERVRAAVQQFADYAQVAENERRIPPECASKMLDLGLARILMPSRFGDYGLGFEIWYDVILEISKADASHGWCAALITHHAQMVAQFPEKVQREVLANGPDVAIAASVDPTATVSCVNGAATLS